MVLHLNNLESASPKDVLWQVWLKSAQWFWIRRLLVYFNYFVIISPWKRTGALHPQKLEYPSLKEVCTTFG